MLTKNGHIDVCKKNLIGSSSHFLCVDKLMVITFFCLFHWAVIPSCARHPGIWNNIYIFFLFFSHIYSGEGAFQGPVPAWGRALGPAVCLPEGEEGEPTTRLKLCQAPCGQVVDLWASTVDPAYSADSLQVQVRGQTQKNLIDTPIV